MKPKGRRREAKRRVLSVESATRWITGTLVAAPAMVTFVCLGIAVLVARAVIDTAEHAMRSLQRTDGTSSR